MNLVSRRPGITELGQKAPGLSPGDVWPQLDR
jgi:hypothetical protein